MHSTTKISSELYQFNDEIALIIVAAKQEGRVYHASNGVLQLIEQFRVPTPHFSDREGIGAEEGNKESTVEIKIHKEYFDYFKKIFHELAPNLKPTHVYLFAPTHTANELEKIMKPLFGNFSIKTIDGIFTEMSPNELFFRLE